MAKNNKPKLTIGMCTYDDFHGTYFTIQAIRLYHQEVLDDIEFVVIDNNPNGKHGKELKSFIEKSVPSGTYIPFSEYTGCGVRSKLFEYANAPAVLCLDCHVLLEAGSLKKLIEYYDDNPDTKNLFHGPLLWEQLENKLKLKDGRRVQNISTEFDLTWRASMWGTWQSNDSLGYNLHDPPFEILAQGLGLFSCRKDAWLGFNKHFREFGGEEGYIHEKFRKAGHKVLCLPFLRWMHRFPRPEGPPYPITTNARIKNYLIGHMELEIELDDMVDHFISEKRITEEGMKKLIADTIGDTGYKPKFKKKKMAKIMNPFKKIEL